MTPTLGFSFGIFFSKNKPVIQCSLVRINLKNLIINFKLTLLFDSAEERTPLVWGFSKKKSFFFQPTSRAFDSRIDSHTTATRESKACEVS
jgi:hypothetical protein